MTINDLYKSGIQFLKDSEIEDAEFDARCLLEYSAGFNTTHFLLHRNDLADENLCDSFFQLIRRRAQNEPLQYIIGEWEFMSNEFYVGPGVLIPRPETEKLVELAVEYLKDFTRPVVVDLCSGSGCIAISVAKLLPNAKVYAVEKFEPAFSYLVKNITSNNTNNVIAVKGDLFDKNVIDDDSVNLILSNPPYIKKAEINNLSPEVQFEPVTALDGGIDGYDFYRFLSDYWLNEFLNFGSAIMVECAEDQGDYISELFSKYAAKTDIIYDFNGLQRIVAAFK